MHIAAQPNGRVDDTPSAASLPAEKKVKKKKKVSEPLAGHLEAPTTAQEIQAASPEKKSQSELTDKAQKKKEKKLKKLQSVGDLDEAYQELAGEKDVSERPKAKEKKKKLYESHEGEILHPLLNGVSSGKQSSRLSLGTAVTSEKTEKKVKDKKKRSQSLG